MKFQEILKSKLVMSILIFIVVSLIAVIAGDVIVKEGNIDVDEDITMAGLLTNTMSATDTTGIYIDGVTNDYNGTTDNYGARVERDIATASGTSSFTSYGVYSDIENTHIISGSPWTASPTNYAIYGKITTSGAHSATPGMSLYEENAASYFSTVRSGTLTSTFSEIKNYGNFQNIVDSVSYNKAGGDLIVNNYAVYAWVASSGSELAGTLTKNNYGLYLKVAGATSGTTTNYGLYIAQSTGADTNWGIYDNSGANWVLDADNQKIVLGEDQDANITFDGTNLRFEYGAPNVSTAWFSGNISATGYQTRTSIYDKSKGSALNYIKDADELKTNGIIDHSKFYGYVSYPVRDESNCWEVIDKYCYGINYTICNEELPKDVKDYITTKRTECGTKTEEAVSLNAEIDVLRQAVYELKTQNYELKTALCSKDSSYAWC